MNSIKSRLLEREAYLEAFQASSGALPGIFAWGLVAGMAMVKSGLSVWQALGMTFFVFAGSAQLASLPLIATNVPIWVVFVTALIVNLRFVIFSAVIGPHFSHLPWFKRIWYGYFTGDITMGFFPQRFPAGTEPNSDGKVGYFTGIGYPNWYMWQSGSVIGILSANYIPQSWGIGFAGTLALLAIMIPLIINKAALAGVIVSAIVAIVAANLPYRLGLLIAVLFGMIVAMILDSMLENNRD